MACATLQHKPDAGASESQFDRVPRHGALRVRLCVLRASSLHEAFGAHAAPGPRRERCARVLHECFAPWQGNRDAAQRGCLFIKVRPQRAHCACQPHWHRRVVQDVASVHCMWHPAMIRMKQHDSSQERVAQVHRAFALGRWDENTGFLHQDERNFDTLCSVHLRALNAAGKADMAAATSKAVDNSRHPRCAACPTSLQSRLRRHPPCASVCPMQIPQTHIAV